MDHHLETIHTAYTISLINLRNSYRKDGICAGRTHFSDIWIRDSFFASLGALSVQDYGIVKRNLQTVMRYMNEDGQVPLRIGQKYFLLKYLGIQRKKQARYMEDKGISVPVDGNSLLMIVFAQYLTHTKDTQFAKNYFTKLKHVIDWNFNQDIDHDLLIEEGGYAGWADSLNKKGKVLYTNTLHYQAVVSFVQICKHLKEHTYAKEYQLLANQINDKINELFWENTYYVDQVSLKKRYIFSTDGNLFAILFGIASLEKIKLILQTVQEFQLESDFSIATNYPKYSSKETYAPFSFIRMSDYHNGLIWVWLGCVNAVAKYTAGYPDEARHILHQIALKIVEYKGVYEVYNHGKPVNRFFYKSEHGFAWSSGLFVWACKQTLIF